MLLGRAVYLWNQTRVIVIYTFPVMRCLLVVTALALLAGCGTGTKMLKDVEPLRLDRPLAVGANDHLVASLDWVTVRNGPAAWARNADWDEYLIRLNNRSSDTMRITDVRVVNCPWHNPRSTIR